MSTNLSLISQKYKTTYVEQHKVKAEDTRHNKQNSHISAVSLPCSPTPSKSFSRHKTVELYEAVVLWLEFTKGRNIVALLFATTMEPHTK